MNRVTRAATATAIAVALLPITATGALAIPCCGGGGGDVGGGTGGGTGGATQYGSTPVVSTHQTVYESDRFDDAVTGDVWNGLPLYIEPKQKVEINASGYVSDGWLFHGYDGPQGWVGNLGGADYPLPGVNTGELLYRLGSDSYRVLGRGVTFTNTSATRKVLYLKRNDNVPGNGSGSFRADVTVFNPL